MTKIEFQPYLKDSLPKPEERPWEAIPSLNKYDLSKTTNYRVQPELLYAMNVALALSKPLLLTGEPGTGKTQFAYYVAERLGLGAPFKFETKSTTEARDLFYQFDALGRFGAEGERRDPQFAREFIHYKALGLALVCANDPETVRDFVAQNFDDFHKDENGNAVAGRSVVLIDEIDKAPRDVPNDLLNEISELYFKVPELPGNVSISCESDRAPIVIFTSNSEKSLPDAFLRRCVYYHIPFPDHDLLSEIVCAHLTGFEAESPLLKDVLDVFQIVRSDSFGIERKPGTAELINWVIVLKELGYSPNDSLSTSTNWHAGYLLTLVKKETDQKQARSLLMKWDWNKPNGGL